ncbi:2-oxoacid:acceptor oxidoreductase family protein [Oscillospiraceae bacterium MB08-C2-2]|nr:2-oxoacid:acceptor oxidoreductase family protein [Oscillospiraceae bacterium MB08-C2-2]
MESLNMIFAGFGGQGVLFTGKIVAYAGLLAGKELSWLPSYGPEMRGGTANCSVCLSDEPIGSPLVTEPDILVAMNGPSFDKFASTVAPGGKIIVDSTLVDREIQRTDIQLFKIPASQLAIDEHLEGIGNMILLGKVLKESEFASMEIVEKAVSKCVPAKKQHLLEPNMRAIKLGMSL